MQETIYSIRDLDAKLQTMTERTDGLAEKLMEVLSVSNPKKIGDKFSEFQKKFDSGFIARGKFVINTNYERLSHAYKQYLAYSALSHSLQHLINSLEKFYETAEPVAVPKRNIEASRISDAKKELSFADLFASPDILKEQEGKLVVYLSQEVIDAVSKYNDIVEGSSEYFKKEAVIKLDIAREFDNRRDTQLILAPIPKTADSEASSGSDTIGEEGKFVSGVSDNSTYDVSIKPANSMPSSSFENLTLKAIELIENSSADGSRFISKLANSESISPDTQKSMQAFFAGTRSALDEIGKGLDEILAGSKPDINSTVSSDTHNSRDHAKPSAVISDEEDEEKSSGSNLSSPAALSLAEEAHNAFCELENTVKVVSSKPGADMTVISQLLDEFSPELGGTVSSSASPEPFVTPSTTTAAATGTGSEFDLDDLDETKTVVSSKSIASSQFNESRLSLDEAHQTVLAAPFAVGNDLAESMLKELQESEVRLREELENVKETQARLDEIDKNIAKIPAALYGKSLEIEKQLNSLINEIKCIHKSLQAEVDQFSSYSVFYKAFVSFDRTKEKADQLNVFLQSYESLRNTKGYDDEALLKQLLLTINSRGKEGSLICRGLWAALSQHRNSLQCFGNTNSVERLISLADSLAEQTSVKNESPALPRFSM